MPAENGSTSCLSDFFFKARKKRLLNLGNLDLKSSLPGEGVGALYRVHPSAWWPDTQYGNHLTPVHQLSSGNSPEFLLSPKLLRVRTVSLGNLGTWLWRADSPSLPSSLYTFSFPFNIISFTHSLIHLFNKYSLHIYLWCNK